MHKWVLKNFDLIKKLLQFIKIVTIFCILMLMFYWVEDIINTKWSWLNFIRPILDFFVLVGEKFSKGSIDVFGAIFEYKYFIATVLFIIINFSMDIAIKVLEKLQDFYESGRTMVKKMEENALNKSLAQDNIKEQAQIKNYQVYVKTFIKKKFDYKGSNVNIDEQNKIMIKFLMEKTGLVPEKFEEGFLFTFNNFNRIDDTLDVFFKLIKSEAPLDYLICVQILDKNYIKQREQLKYLIGFKFLNKISMLSDTVWRYSYNPIQKYKTSQLGVFQKGETTYEAHEFILM